MDLLIDSYLCPVQAENTDSWLLQDSPLEVCNDDDGEWRAC